MRVFPSSFGRWGALLLVSSLLLAAPRRVFAQSDAAPGTDTPIAEARRHFELGIAHFDRKAWQAALVEFLRSRELAPNRANTKNAAICLRKVGRFDEAIDLFAALLRDFPNLPAADRELARREIAELGAFVGTLELRDVPPGASVSIDGVDRGTTPLAGPVRLVVGTHTVRVLKDGSLPFEARIDLSGREAEILPVRLASLTQAGRLRVTEKNDRKVDVLIDGSRVGTTPWDGALAPGVHSVSLRGAGTLGTPPTRITVAVERETALELAAIHLDSELSVNARPEAALIFVDGALAGRGHWTGRVQSGSHRVEATLAGYRPFSRVLTLASDENRSVPVTLEPLVQKARIVLELDAGIPLGLVWGGDLENDCTPPCTSSLPVGVFVQAHARYRFSVGVGLGIHAGYLRMGTTLTGREETVAPQGVEPHRGTVDDHLRLGGLMAGGEADYVTGKTWPLSLRFSAGLLLGTTTDERTGTFTDSSQVRYGVSTEQNPRASYFYLGPEVRLGYRVGKHFEASLGAKLFVFAALVQPSWDGTQPVWAGEVALGGYFPQASLTGDVMMAALPGLAATYAF